MRVTNPHIAVTGSKLESGVKDHCCSVSVSFQSELLAEVIFIQSLFE